MLPIAFFKELITFTILKHSFIILILLIGTSISTHAQNKSVNSADESAKLIKFFPNPASSYINFELQRAYDQSYTLILFNFMGKKMEELVPGSQIINLSLNTFYRGIYIFQLRDKKGKIIESGKFQVVK
ncbi:MAG: T9SS C-terminal target domain-containing protein [Chitinophagia bacterium]|nr:T9SS C-terminal target domain-containing protein [Chitinophagia bacterium]